MSLNDAKQYPDQTFPPRQNAKMDAQTKNSAMIGETLRHYRIEAKLGAGGMGVVYRALDTHLDRSVAVKVLPSTAVANADRRARFSQEAKSASALSNRHIVTIFY